MCSAWSQGLALVALPGALAAQAVDFARYRDISKAYKGSYPGRRMPIQPADARGVAMANQNPSESKPDLQVLLGPPPLLEGEDPTAYDALRRWILAEAAPTDVIEEILVREFADLQWEINRLRRLKAKLMKCVAHEGLDKLLEMLVNEKTICGSVRRGLVVRWTRRDPEAINQVNDLLKGADLDQESIAAQTLAVKLDVFAQMDRMIMQSEARRNATLREVDRHREALARRLREASVAIEDAEFTEIAPARRDAAE